MLARHGGEDAILSSCAAGPPDQLRHKEADQDRLTATKAGAAGRATPRWTADLEQPRGGSRRPSQGARETRGQRCGSETAAESKLYDNEYCLDRRPKTPDGPGRTQNNDCK